MFVSPIGALFSGAEISILNLMEYLSKNGHKVYNVIPDNETNADLNYIKRMEEAGVEYYSLRSLCWWWLESKDIPEADRTAATLYQHKNIADIRRIIRDEKIDLVISNTVHVFQGAIAAALENSRHYYLIHEFPNGEFEYYKEKLPLIDLLSDKIFAVDGGLYEELLNYFPTEKLSSFIPYSQAGGYKLKVGSKTRIVSIGGLSEWKNQLELIKVFERIQSPDLELVFIGNWHNEYKAICDEYISENTINNVQFLGYQANPWSFVTDRDIVVFPSKFEAFGLVLAEAILNAVPYVASNNLGHCTVGKFFETQNFYSLGNIDDLEDSISYILENYECCKERAQQLSVVAQQKYNIFETSKNIINSINSDFSPLQSKKLQGLPSLLGISLSNDTLHYIENEKITVFYANEDNMFTELNSEIFPLDLSSKIKIYPKISSKIRIDLTENPCVLKNVTLISNETGDVLQPIYTNAIIREDYFIFYQEDPQIVFDTSKYHNHVLVLSYTFAPIGLLGDKLHMLFEEYKHQIDSFKNQILQNEQEFSSSIHEKDIAIQNLNQQYIELENQFTAVLNSKRWRLATRIANLFRRKK
ncbi:glycosyltransferase family 4 protein [Streptococcus suis]|uniref:glycosyltransferase family 4 protein n=1 Tax=Streptococcus suis TaxID=1307 RepID=UPI00069BBE52|nr:glycosyltransferase family 4 protein [Streptococcus suis]NQH61896.1 glycosyltransferase family 4 protein [Streptococcus suis]NQN11094.1 glycosyltransferase family 4 protein [Streptococcus suis]UTI55804.1 glycosyltransferase family 4 protein [Streptococcus suis]